MLTFGIILMVAGFTILFVAAYRLESTVFGPSMEDLLLVSIFSTVFLIGGALITFSSLEKLSFS